jgi:hypothetical protein
VNALHNASFPDLAERSVALYNEETDALLLGMLGQEYVVRHDGILLHGQKAPESHTAILLDYLFGSGSAAVMMPWRAISDFTGRPFPEFKKRVEVPLTNYAAEIISRADSLLPMIDAEVTPSLIGSDMAITIRALPKVSLHVELSQETQDFPAEAWVLFSNNANEFLTAVSLQLLAEVFKDRMLSLIRIY